MPWHDNQSTRQTFGDAGERLFEMIWKCHCGAEFVHQKGPVPDFRCPKCGQLVDVKSISHDDHLAISQIPFDNYPPDLIVALYGDIWLGCHRKDIKIFSGPNPPAHNSRATWYYWVETDKFIALDFMLRRKPELPLDTSPERE